MTNGYIDFINKFSKSWSHPDRVLPYWSFVDVLIYAPEIQKLCGETLSSDPEGETRDRTRRDCRLS